MKSNKKLESIRHFFFLSRKKKKVSSHIAFCVGWCWRWRGSSQKKECEMWWHFSFVPTIVSFFSPVCDVEPSCLLCSPTFYSFSVAPFFLIFHFLQCWPHNLNLSFLHSSFHRHISVSWKRTHTHMHAHTLPRTHIPRNALWLLNSSTVSLYPSYMNRTHTYICI